MIRRSRRSAFKVIGAALAAPMIARHAHAAEITWRIGHVAPVETPLHRQLLDAAKSINKRSDGMMEIIVVGEGRLGVQSGLLAQVRAGSLEMTVATCNQLEPEVPFCAIPTTGFMFADYASVWPAMDGDLGLMVRSQIRAQLNLMILDRIWDFGFRHITTSERPIQTAADLAGMKIRTQVSADQMDMFRSLDAIPVVITLPYLRAALEHHQIDGQEGMLPVLQYARLNEVQNYCALTHHGWDGFWICINSMAWDRLPDRLRNIVVNTINGAAQRQREDSARAEETVRAALMASGMKFPKIDLPSFREALRRQGHYGRVRSKLGDKVWEVVQRSTGLPS